MGTATEGVLGPVAITAEQLVARQPLFRQFAKIFGSDGSLTPAIVSDMIDSKEDRLGNPTAYALPAVGCIYLIPKIFPGVFRISFCTHTTPRGPSRHRAFHSVKLLQGHDLVAFCATTLARRWINLSAWSVRLCLIASSTFGRILSVTRPAVMVRWRKGDQRFLLVASGAIAFIQRVVTPSLVIAGAVLHLFLCHARFALRLIGIWLGETIFPKFSQSLFLAAYGASAPSCAGRNLSIKSPTFSRISATRLGRTLSVARLTGIGPSRIAAIPPAEMLPRSGVLSCGAPNRSKRSLMTFHHRLTLAYLLIQGNQNR